jgi:hypothetical protein
MDKSKVHMIPQVILDIYDSIQREKSNQFVRDNHVLRLEAIHEFCEKALEKIRAKNYKS